MPLQVVVTTGDEIVVDMIVSVTWATQPVVAELEAAGYARLNNGCQTKNASEPMSTGFHMPGSALSMTRPMEVGRKPGVAS